MHYAYISVLFLVIQHGIREKQRLGTSSEGEGAAASLRSEKVIEKGDFRGFDSFQAGRMDDKK